MLHRSSYLHFFIQFKNNILRTQASWKNDTLQFIKKICTLILIPLTQNGLGWGGVERGKVGGRNFSVQCAKTKWRQLLQFHKKKPRKKPQTNKNAAPFWWVYNYTLLFEVWLPNMYGTCVYKGVVFNIKSKILLIINFMFTAS